MWFVIIQSSGTGLAKWETKCETITDVESGSNKKLRRYKANYYRRIYYSIALKGALLQFTMVVKNKI